MRCVDLILKKKSGLELTKEEINYIISGFVSGEIPDYQISSLLMAICFKGLSDSELFSLTEAMLRSGDEVDLSMIDGICIDKHSTGGVGDKTTLVIAPICASFGLKIAKMSGRGLGHTGGTLDKLESIPGFNINLSIDQFIKQVNSIGLSVIGQTKNIAPADKKLYALRDVTGTVESIGLIASSIMSKKLASGAKIILLDVKVGDGAFMKTKEQAEELARKMVAIGKNFDRKVVAMLTDMDQPLGVNVGNSLEVIEAIETLKGNGPKDFTELCYRICTEILLLADITNDSNKAREMIKEKIESKEALGKLKEMISWQNGNSEVINDYSIFGDIKETLQVLSDEEGYIESIDTLSIGISAMQLGAGRELITDDIDPTVGISCLAKKGDFIKKGDVLGIIYTNGKNTQKAYEMFKNAFKFTKTKQKKEDIILGIVGE